VIGTLGGFFVLKHGEGDSFSCAGVETAGEPAAADRSDVLSSEVSRSMHRLHDDSAETDPPPRLELRQRIPLGYHLTRGQERDIYLTKMNDPIPYVIPGCPGNRLWKVSITGEGKSVHFPVMEFS
jgi:hypothetical protein